MKCNRYALYISDTGRRVTQPLPFDGEAPKYYDCKDGERLPLRMIGHYDIESDTTSHVDVYAGRMAQDAADRRRREFNVRRAS
jgi:hypothetical protein